MEFITDLADQVQAMRTFAMAGALGMIAYGFRALLGRERGFYAGGASGE